MWIKLDDEVADALSKFSRSDREYFIDILRSADPWTVSMTLQNDLRIHRWVDRNIPYPLVATEVRIKDNGNQRPPGVSVNAIPSKEAYVAFMSRNRDEMRGVRGTILQYVESQFDDFGSFDSFSTFSDYDEDAAEDLWDHVRFIAQDGGISKSTFFELGPYDAGVSVREQVLNASIPQLADYAVEITKIMEA